MKKLLALIATAFIGLSASAGEYPDISIAELKEAIAEKKVAVIDVNGTSSWEKGHVPGAIDFGTKKAELATLLPEDKATLIVAYCGGPTCGAYKAAAKAAEDLGYTNVKHLSAGISGWLQAGEATEKAK
jgi:rhodanese-related sulfurtransferase